MIVGDGLAVHPLQLAACGAHGPAARVAHGRGGARGRARAEARRAHVVVVGQLLLRAGRARLHRPALGVAADGGGVGVRDQHVVQRGLKRPPVEQRDDARDGRRPHAARQRVGDVALGVVAAARAEGAGGAALVELAVRGPHFGGVGGPRWGLMGARQGWCRGNDKRRLVLRERK